jgi:hypothetical protein
MRNPDLGSPITAYHVKQLLWIDILRVFLPILLVVLTPVFYGFWRTLYGYSNFGPAAAAVWGRNWFLIGGVLVIFLLFYTFNRLKKAHTWVQVYRWGLVFHFPPNRKRQIEWDDIYGLTSYSINKSFLGIGNKTSHHLILHTRRYPPISCHPAIRDLEGLKKTIKKQVYGRIRPKLMAAFKEGEILTFGEVSLSKKALFPPKQEIPWEYIEEITVQKGIFIVRLTAQKQLEIPIRRLTNLEILIHLIKTEI